MDPETQLTHEQRQAVDEFRKRHRTALLALLFSDVEGSTALRNAMGELPASALIERHGHLAREVLAQFADAQEIFTAGDSFFIVFAKPSDAVRFALLAQVRFRQLAAQQRPDFRVKIGIHLGEVVVAEDVEGGTVRDVLGMQVDLASRVTGLASGGQILMTRGVFDNARQILRGQLLPGIGELSWLSHGPYLLKGFDEPLGICEVGETGRAKLAPPTDTETGKRAVVPGTEPVLGWRPAVEQMVPGTEWALEKKLGEGGFGEVWLARHRRTKEQRVFKFCFRADRLRSLKRELTIFRMLKEQLGTRQDIARLIEVQFEEAPYYLELEYAPGGDLARWAETRGGLENIPLYQRLEIAAQIATALSAAHSVGVIHRDVKPSNVLIEDRKDGTVQVRLTDFGIGELKDRSLFDKAGITMAGFTETVGAMRETPSLTGTRLYMAPELTADRPPTIQSDIYSLGVLLYQLIVGDLTQPMTTDWERRVADPLLREDLRACLAGEPTDRLSAADELSRRLRTLDERRAERAKREAAERVLARRRGLARAAMAAAALLVIVALALGYGLYRAERARRQLLVEQERTKRENYYSTIRFATMAIDESRFDQARELLADCPSQFRAWEWGHLQYLCNHGWTDLATHTDSVRDIAFSPDGRLLASAGDDWIARVWDLDKDQEMWKFEGHTGTIVDLAFSPNGKWLATASLDNTAIVWDVRSGRLWRRLENSSRHIHAVAFAPDGRLATGSCDYRMRLWNPETGEELKSVKIPSWEFMGIEIMPDGKRCVTRGYAPLLDPGTHEVWLFDMETGQMIRVFAGHTKSIASIALSPDGRLLATGSADETVKIWEVETGRALQTLQGHSQAVTDVAFSADGRLLATGSADKTARLWDISTGRLLQTFRGHSDWVLAVAVSPDGKYLATGGSGKDPTVRLWPIEPAALLLASVTSPEAESDSPSSPTEVHRARQPEEANQGVWEQQAEGRLRVFDDYAGNGPGIALSNGGVLAMATPEGTVALADAETGRRLLTFRSGALVRSIAARPDGRLLAGGCVGGTIVLWDLETGLAIRTLQHGIGVLHQVAFSPDGSRLASAVAQGEQQVSAVDKTAKIWEVRTGRLLTTLEGHTDVVNRLAFSPDGSRIVTAGFDQTLRFWDADSGRLLGTFEEDGVPRTVVFSSDGRWLLSSTDRSLKIRKTQPGEELPAVAAQVSPVNAVLFGPDSRRFVTGGNDQAVKVWDTETRREVLSLLGHEGALSALAFSPDGLQLATADSDGRVIVWPAFPWRVEAYPGNNTMSVEERIAHYRRKRWNRRLAVASDNLPVGGARRSFDRSGYTPGVPVNMNLDLEWNANASSVTIREVVPAGWSIQNVSHGGRREGQTIAWNVSPWTSPGVVLRYTATPPPAGDSAPVLFADALVRSDKNQWFRIADTSFHRVGTRVFQDGTHPGPDYQGGQDTHIIALFENRNTGSSRMLEEGAWSGQQTTDHKKILIQFDLSSVPTTFSLARAELRLFAFNERLGGLRTTHTLYAARVVKPWAEGQTQQRQERQGGQGGYDGEPARPGAVTFVSARHNEQPWERPGTLGLTDVDDAESSTTAGADWPEWVAFDVTDSVRRFLRDPSANHGWKISQDPARDVDDATIQYVNGIFGYKSSEAPEVHLRPILILIPEELAGGTSIQARP